MQTHSSTPAIQRTITVTGTLLVQSYMVLYFILWRSVHSGSSKNKAGQAVFCIAYSYGWNLVYIAQKKKKICRAIRGIPKQLNWGIELLVSYFISIPVLVQAWAASMPRMGHVARGKTNSCVPETLIRRLCLLKAVGWRRWKKWG